MANAFIKKYPLDRTSKAVTNRIEDEPHVVGVQFNRIVAPNAGPYYEDSMVIEDTVGNVLVKGVDWDPILPYVEASMTLSAPVANMIVIKNKNITEIVLKKYQVPGGLYQTYTDAMIDLINSLMQDNREVQWDNIGGKPIRFQPTPHLHHLKDLYGFEYEVLALEEILRAIQQGDVASHDVIYQYIENLRDWTKEQLNKAQDQIDDLYREIERLDVRIDSVLADLDVVRKDLAAHVADKQNPHAVTKAQTGLGLVENYRVATNAEAVEAVKTDAYLVPAHLKAYADAKIFPVIQAHLNDKQNPHGTTKAQVGLGKVEDYPIATQQQAQVGTDNASYMTPLRVAEYCNSKVVPTLNAHIADKNNPHGVTKAQTGLGSVQNYPMADQGTAQGMASNSHYMSPLSTAWLFDTRLGNNRAVNGSHNPNDGKLVSFWGGWTRVAANLQLQHPNGVNYNIMFDGGNTLTFTHNINVNDAYIRSDERVKSKIRYLTETKEQFSPKLRQLATAVARYELNTDPDVEQIGVIAQLIEKYMPELVRRDSESDYLSVKPAGFIAMLLKGWSEHDDRLSSIEKLVGIA